MKQFLANNRRFDMGFFRTDNTAGLGNGGNLATNMTFDGLDAGSHAISGGAVFNC